MIHRTILAVALVAALAGSAIAQAAPDARARKSDETMAKIRQLDLLNHILPLLWTRRQINDVLPAIERSRERVRNIQRLEHDELVAFEKRIDESIENGINKQAVPPTQLMTELRALLISFSVRRANAAEENANAVLAAMKRSMNEGQLRAAAGSLDARVQERGLDTSGWTQDDRIKYFIKDILLDPQAYDILVRLSRIVE
ncbi:MAG: hypothetical protein SNJ74_09445 [Fimbriimonadaceae bacterium]